MITPENLKVIEEEVSEKPFVHAGDVALDNVELPESTLIPEIHTVHFNITNTCNLKCSMCYINAVQRPTTQLPLSLVEKLAEDFKRLGGKKVTLSGGEPLVRKD